MEDMENMENMEVEDIYYVEIPNNKRFKGVYVNKNAILEQETFDEKVRSIETDVEALMLEIKQLNIDIELKKYLFKREFEMYRLKRKLNELRDEKLELALKLSVMNSEFEQLKRDLLGTEDDIVDTGEDIDED